MKIEKKQAVTLMELVVVMIVVGILAGVVAQEYLRSRERAMDKKAQAILTAIRAAERTYWIEMETFYTPGATTVADLNQNIRTDLVDDGDWSSYNVGSAAGFTASVNRNSGGFSRTWTITLNQENASCSGNCP